MRGLTEKLKNLGYISLPIITSAAGAIAGYTLTGSIPISVSTGLLGLPLVPYVNRKVYLERTPSERTVKAIFEQPIPISEEMQEAVRESERTYKKIEEIAKEIRERTEIVMKESGRVMAESDR